MSPSQASRGSLRVLAAGICCAVGYHGAAACCALRAGIDHFQESEFVTGGGEPVRVARLPDTEHWGAERLALWIGHAVDDCLGTVPDFVSRQTPLIMLTLEPSRPHGQEHEQLETALAVQRLLDLPLHAQSRVFAAGRAGLAMALSHAAALVNAGRARRVLLVGADSYLNAASISHYLAAERLLVPGNRDGFLPGEAAAAVLLEASDLAQPGTHVAGVGRGRESGRPDGSVPSRGQGLSAAIRAALAQAGIDADALTFRLSDQNGEGFFAAEAANALTRIGADAAHTPATLTTADCVGEIGAATGPLMLAWLADLMPRADGPGDCGLIHLANDDGERSAVVVRHIA